MLQLLAGAHGIPGWLAGIDSWRLAMMLIALPGPVFFLLVLTMPLGHHGGGAGSPAAADDAAPRDFIPYATAPWRTPACIFGPSFAMAVAVASGLTWFPDRKRGV